MFSVTVPKRRGRKKRRSCPYMSSKVLSILKTSPEIYRVETDVVIDVVVQGAQELDGETLEIDDLFDVISSNVVDC